MKISRGSILPKLAKALIIADARYFCNMGFEPPDTLSRVEKWLNGGYDPDIRAKVICWIKADMVWTDEIRDDVAQQFWYLKPIVMFVSYHIHAEKWLKILEGE